MPLTLRPFQRDEAKGSSFAVIEWTDVEEGTYDWVRRATADARERLTDVILQEVLKQQRDEILKDLTPEFIAECTQKALSSLLYGALREGLERGQ